jgi:pSer/pThr/pTyr-binding forkhead associated (FHA) protein
MLHQATPQELRDRLEAERRGSPFLLYRDGAGTQHIRDLADVAERLTIGRSPASGLAVEWDGEASRIHTVLERVGDEWTLLDDGRSRNGTFLDGERVSGRVRLRDGDTIGVGRTLFLFRSPSGNESVQTTPSPRFSRPVVSTAQRRVLVALCRPYVHEFAVPASNRQIADELTIGLETVKTHLRALFEAFSLGDLPQHHKRATLAQMALELGVVDRRELG